MSPTLSDESMQENHLDNNKDVTTTTTTINNNNGVLLKHNLDKNNSSNNIIINNNIQFDETLNQFLTALVKLRENGIDENDSRYKSLLQLAQIYYNNNLHANNSNSSEGVLPTVTKTVTSNDKHVNNKDSNDADEDDDEDVEMNGDETNHNTEDSTMADATTSTADNIATELESMNSEQTEAFKAEVVSFKYLSRNLPIPMNSISQIANILPSDPNYTNEVKFHPRGSIKIEQMYPNPDLPETNKGLYDAYRSIHEREDRINSKIQYRLEELKELPSNILPELKTSSLIEMKQLKVLSVQKKVRSDIVNELSHDIFLNSVQEVNMFVRPIPRAASKPSEIMYDVTNTQAIPESILVTNKKKFLQCVFNHYKEFKEYHNQREKLTKNIIKSIARYHKEKEKREQELLEKKRIEMLRKGDNEGYRDLLAKTKNERLEILLSQTDTLLAKIDFLVQKEKVEQEERAEREREKLEKEEEERREREKRENGVTPNGNIELPTKSSDEDKEKENEKDQVQVQDQDQEKNTDDKKDEEKKDDDKADGTSTTTSTATPTTTTTTTSTSTTATSGTTVSTAIHKRTHMNKIEIVKEQPEVMTGGKLKEYQITGLQWMVNLYNNKLNGILADEMGLGKTVQTIALVCYLFERKVLEPYLIVAPLSTISNWESEFARWAPKLQVIVYRGKPDERRALAKRIPRNGFIVIITSFEYVIADKNILSRYHWCYVIIDEGHRIKNKSAKLSVQLRQYYSKNRLLLTGTPLQNDLGELWSLLNFLLPNIFNSLDTFEQWFNAPFATGNKKNAVIKVNEEESLIIINRLHQVLRYFLLRRLKKDVESQLPEKKERVIKCNLSAMQIAMYRSIAEYGQLPMDPNSEIYKKSRSKMRGFNNVVKQLQKVANHPYLFLTEWDINDDLIRASGKFDMMDQILTKMKASGHRVLIFTQMTEIINIMVEYFSLREWDFLRLDGSTKPEERSRLVVEWNSKESPYFIFVLSTHAGGLGMNLQTADTVIIFDSDWNPQMDLQAQDRCHRVGQVNRVNVFRLISASTIEERILERATDKLDLDAKIIQAGMFNTHSNDQERRAKLEEFLHGFPNNTTDEVPTDLEEINRLISRDDEEFVQFQEMDAEKARNEKKSPKKKIHKPRLISESELPEWMLRSPVEEEEQTPAQRKRTTIHNNAIDDLTEVQFSQMIELGMSLPEYKDYLENRKKRNKLKKDKRKKRGAKKGEDGEEDEEDDDDDDDDDELDEEEVEDEEEDQDYEEPEEEVKVPRKRGRPPKRQHKEIDPVKDEETEEPKDEEKAAEEDENVDVDGTTTTTTTTTTTPSSTPGRRGRKKLRPDSPSSPPPQPPAPTPKSGRGRGRGRPPKDPNAVPSPSIDTKPEDDTDKDVKVDDDSGPQSPQSRSKRKLTFVNRYNNATTDRDQPMSPESPAANNNTTTATTDQNNSETPDNGTPYKPRRSSALASLKRTPFSAPLSPPAAKDVDISKMDDSAKMNLVWERMKIAKDRTRKISELFYELPGRELYPDYYNVIKNPISMKEIKEKTYSTPEDFSQDWKVMFNNALAYNDPGSQVYNDALNLYNNIFKSSMKEIFEIEITDQLDQV